MTYLMRDYDNALKLILNEGVTKKNRTGIETLSVCGIQSRYRIDKCFPIITGRKVWPKAVFAELLWFISGSTNNNDLKKIYDKYNKKEEQNGSVLSEVQGKEGNG